MNKEFFNPEAIQLILRRAFNDIPNCFSYSEGKISGVVLNNSDAVSVTINGVTIPNTTGILILQDYHDMIEISGIHDTADFSITHTFPLGGLWQFGICRKIAPPENDHHG